MSKKGLYKKTAKRMERQKANKAFKKELKTIQCPECLGYYAKYIKNNLGERIICRKCGALLEEQPKYPTQTNEPPKKKTLSWYALIKEKITGKPNQTYE